MTKVISFNIMIEVLEEDYSEAAMIRLMAKFEDLVYQNNYELFDFSVCIINYKPITNKVCNYIISRFVVRLNIYICTGGKRK